MLVVNTFAPNDFGFELNCCCGSCGGENIWPENFPFAFFMLVNVFPIDLEINADKPNLVINC